MAALIPRLRPPASGPLREVFLVLPGLNLDPCRMNPLMDWMAARGLGLLEPFPEGLGPPLVSAASGPQQAGSAAPWLERLDNARQWLRQAHPEARVSLLGYSLGGLLGLCWSAQRGEETERMILLAPAVGVGPWFRLLLRLGLTVLPREISLPSLAPPSHRLAPLTPLAAYAGLESLLQRWTALEGGLEGGKKGPLPALPRMFVALHPRDELVDAAAVERMVARGGPGSRLFRLDNRRGVATRRGCSPWPPWSAKLPYHLII
ncbi:MAG: alpha/beta hydrolase, partial [Deltaproteobacteria bacterium]|nr:alpha/beta hydrolase [Deltaproteobacteria bacterium]